MATFSLFKRDKRKWVRLPAPDDSLSFFKTLKQESEKFWVDALPDKGIYGFQIQQDSKWREGLSDAALQAFEEGVGFSFPAPLRNFYTVMNGLTKPGINLYGGSGTPPAFRPVFYSYPADLPVIKKQIERILETTPVKREDLEGLGISRIFPVFQHRFILIDSVGNPVLSMYGEDVIYGAENLSKLLATEIFGGALHNATDFESPPSARPDIKFWLDEDRC